MGRPRPDHGKTMSSLPDLGFTMASDKDKPVPGLGPSSRARTSMGFGAGTEKPIEEPAPPDQAPSARDGGGHFARMKVAELKARMADMDKDLETQSLVRKQRDMKVQRVMNDMGQVEPALNNMNQKIVDMNDTVKGVKRDLVLQMDSQATMRKELMVVLEDKTKGIKTSLSTDIDILKDHFRAISSRLRKLEDAQTGGGEVAEIKQRINTLDNYNVRVGQRLADLAKSIEAGNSDRLKDQAVLSDRFSTQIAHGTAALDAEAQARERNERRMTENMKSNTDDLEATLTDARQQLQFSIENVSKTTEEKFGAAHAAIEASIRAAKDEDANIRSKITEEVFNLDRKVEDELKRRQVEQDKTVRLLEDKIHSLTQSMERNSEASSVAIRALQQQLDTERDERVAFEDSMMRLVEEQLSKVHMGIEAHPNVSSEH